MKKIIILILSAVIVVLAVIYMNYKNELIVMNDSKDFNKEFEFYNKEEIFGTDITSLINKATDNNEKYNIEKTEEGKYVLDDKYSTEIYVYFTSTEKTYPMESFNNAGLEEFTKLFGAMSFKCTDVKYHEKTGKISSMTFSSIEK